ncbi:MAG: hypothetical protein JXB24_13585 [Bacteroidales bacterium]|nr:hypothetical protein [Bacteroidales bacterium]
MNLKIITLKYWIIAILVFLVLIMGLFFFSNRTLHYFFKDKIWAHKVNTIEKLDKAKKRFSGIELDVVFYSDSNYFDVNHPPEKSTDLSLIEYFQSQEEHVDQKYWIDCKNLNYYNQTAAVVRLDSISQLFKINKKNIIVESVHPEFLTSFADKGFLTSYYLPQKLYMFDQETLNLVIERIKINVIISKTTYLSTDYRDYNIIDKYFPEHPKLIWFVVYGEASHIKARILLYKILLDEKVDVLLIPYP